MSESARDRWVRREADSLVPVLEPLGYSADECLRLAMLMYDMNVDGPTDGLSPEQMILRELIMMQGFDAATAGIVASALVRLDLGRIEISSRAACDMLGVSRNSLRDNMISGAVPAWNVLMAGDRQDQITYGLARLLYTRAWRRRNPRPRGTPQYPPPEYNAARWAIERRRRQPTTGTS